VLSPHRLSTLQFQPLCSSSTAASSAKPSVCDSALMYAA